MKITLNIPIPSWRDPRRIVTYIKTYRNLPQPQWANPTKKIGIMGSLKLWWIIEKGLTHNKEAES